jgi:SPP1 gp7 family putative phage head morphogenesis protein
MGLFDFLKKAQEKVDALQKQITEAASAGNILPQRKIEPKIAEPKEHKQSKVAKQIIRRFYSDYPETPYISNDRKNDWIERAELFPKQNIIPKSMMKRYADGLLPGHVYMLHWLKKYTNKKVPAYFEYKYGIDFEKEKSFLRENNFLDDANKPTAKGEKAITQHSKVIENHTAATEKPTITIKSISKQVLAQRNNIARNGFKEFEFIASRHCCEICGKLNGQHFPVSEFEIGVNAPPMHEGCSCSIAAYSDRSEYEKWLNSL